MGAPKLERSLSVYVHTRGGRMGSGIVPFERALVSSCGPSILTFPLSLRVSEILPLCSAERHFFLTPLLVSPNLPHVPLGVGRSPFGCKERKPICPCNYFSRFPTYVITNHQRHRRTDRRTDDMRSQDRAYALKCIAR